MKGLKSLIAFMGLVVLLTVLLSVLLLDGAKSIREVVALEGKDTREDQFLGSISSFVSSFYSRLIALITSFPQVVVGIILSLVNAIVGIVLFFVSSVTTLTTTTTLATTTPSTSMAMSTMASTPTATTGPATVMTTVGTQNPTVGTQNPTVGTTVGTTNTAVSTAATTNPSSTSASTSSSASTTTTASSTAATANPSSTSASTSLSASTTTTAASTAATTNPASTSASTSSSASTTTTSMTTTSSSTSAPPPEGLVVFVTSSSFTGNLGGIDGADQKCADAALVGQRNGTFLAWISTASVSPSSRFNQTDVPYVRTDGTFFAENLTDLFSNGPDVTLNFDESGNMVPTSEMVWTNTNSDGTRASPTDCENWQQVAAGRIGTTIIGSTGQTTFWTNQMTGSCVLTQTNRLFCFEQAE